MTSARPFVAPLDLDDRLADEDQAAARDQQFLDAALMAQRLKAEGGALYQRGICANCGERVAPPQFYCDADCKADHEHRLAVLARQGKR